MYKQEIEKLIQYAFVDGNITPKERKILIEKAIDNGIDKDEFEMVLDARIYEFNKMKQHIEDGSSQKRHTKTSLDISNKCPNCQANIDASSTSCEYCNYNIVNRATNTSIQRLFELLNKAEEQRKSEPDGLASSMAMVFSKAFSDITGPGKVDRQKMEIISSFPIPTTKHDILEFISLAYPKAKQAGNFFTRNSEENKIHNQFAMVWKKKCEQIILKAKFTMKDDKETLNEVLYYGKMLGIN